MAFNTAPLPNIVNNASGESAASMEALGVNKSLARQGIKHEIIDSRSGALRPAIGLRPEDNTLNPYDVLVQNRGGTRTVMNQGAKAVTSSPSVMKWLSKIMPSLSVVSIPSATNLYNQIKQVGPQAGYARWLGFDAPNPNERIY